MKPAFLACSLLCCFLTSGIAQKAALDSVYQLAGTKSASGDVPGATSLLLSAQKIAEDLKDTAYLCRIQVTFGKLGLISENNDAVDKALIKAEIYCVACKDTINQARIYLQKGILQIKGQQYDTAIAFFKHSSDLYLLKHDTIGSANVLAKIGNVLEQQKHYAEAQPYYLAFYEAARKNPESFNFLTANIYLTGNYHYLHQSEKALFHNNLVMKLSQKLNSNFEYAQALYYDALIQRQMGQYETAFTKLIHYVEYYQDTLMNKMQMEQTEEMKAKYEAEKKEAQIALQEAQLRQERFRFWVVIAGLVTALIAGGLLFRLTRRLRKRNEEKEFLIKEIHHRVKNNLQILSSLLHLQSRQITDDTALDAVREGQSRVDAMGLIHQKLYMGDNVAKVEMKEYLEQFGQNMLDSFGIEDDRISIVYDLQPMYLDVDTAIPLGLIINELVTNSLKYAFPGEQSGAITIALWKDDKSHLCLKVSDDGAGQSAEKDDKKSTSFGTSLVQMLSKKLKGKPEVLQQEHGYATLIVFEKYD